MAKTTVAFTDTKRVKELIALMTENGLTEIELVEDKAKITLRRTQAAAAPAAPVHAAPVAAVPAPAHVPAVPAQPAEEEKLVSIKSPMVGTFYTAPSPEADAYVAVGSHVTDESVVCIIEAMKVFNEIRAETTGTIARILVQNGQAVEFGQPLYLVRPD